MLQWIPNIDDDGKFLACRAENPKLPEAAIEDRWKLKVHCEYGLPFDPIERLGGGKTKIEKE